MTVYVRMRRIRFSNGGTTSTLLGTTTFPLTNYTTSHPLKPKSILKLLPSRTPLFTSPHYRLVTTAQHHSSSTSHILPTPQTNNLSGGDGQNGYPLKDSKVILKRMTYTDLEKWVQSHGYRPAQALMLWKCLYGDNIWAQCSEELEGLFCFPCTCYHRFNVESVDGLNKDFRKMLSEHAEFKTLNLKEILTASDGTKKMLFKLEDDLVIETVLIPCERGRNTVCISSQVGCAMNCQFCYTGRMGLKRNLSTSEIVEQAVVARRLLSSEVGPISNVVFMGMGEPLHNIENVLKAADILVDEQGLHFSPRKVTVSTSGLVPQLKRFLRESNCALAVSLNATTDEVRSWIMPINRKFNLNLLLGTLREELQSKHKYKVLFEYVLLAGVNDSVEDAKRLIDLVQGIPCKINLITFNPHSGSFFKPTKKEKILEFRNILAEAGCVVLFRCSRGDDQMAACGQLGKPGEIQAPMLRVPSQFQAVLEAAV